MANIMDYLEWRGDLTFAQSPFNEVDNLILSELVYVEFAGIVPSPGKGSITLEEANTAFFSTHTDEEINARVSSTKVAAFMMREMAKTNRFGKIKLSGWKNSHSSARWLWNLGTDCVMLYTAGQIIPLSDGKRILI